MPPPSEGWSGVTFEDVTDRYPGEPPFGDDKITVYIADAEDAIWREFPDAPERLASGALPTRTLVRVISRMIIRLMRNPAGVRTIQQGGGPFSGSTTFAGDHPGEVYLTDDDRRDLAGDAPRGRQLFGFTPVLRRGAW